MLNIRRFENGLQIVPNPIGNVAPDIQGELAVWDRAAGGDGNLYYNNGLTTYAITAAITGFTGDISSTAGPGVVDVTVLTVGGASAASIAAAAAASGNATSSDTPNTLVLRDGSGDFAAGTITANLIGNVTGNLIGNVTGNVSGTSSNITGILSPFNGGTGIANSNSATLTFTNTFPLSLTTSASTSLILPVTGTLATLNGVETFSNKTFSNQQDWLEITTPVTNPPSGYISIYAKSDNNIYTLTSGGLETPVSGATLTAPVGSITMFGGTTIPAGWLLCDGSAVSKVTYSNLYSIIGFNYGSGNPATQTTASLTTTPDVSTAAFASIGPVTITAVMLGFVGNSISLVFNGTSDIAVVTTAWNSANPSNQVTYTGPGTYVPSSQTLNLSGGDSTTDGTYFEIYDDTGLVAVWLTITIPPPGSPPGGAYRTINVTGITTDETATNIASAIAATLAADGQFTPTTSTSNVVTITNTSTMSHSAGNAGTTPFVYMLTNTGGLSTFNIPDFRGFFPRGTDNGAGRDPDAASRTGFTGGNTGDNVGSTQSDAYETHRHSIDPNDDDMQILTTNAGGFGFTSGTGAAFIGRTGGAPVTGTVSSETRGINLYVNFLIKF